MKLFRVTIKEDMICGRRKVFYVAARDADEAKHKALKQGGIKFPWDTIEVDEESEEQI
jgi:hypothetical protein